MITARRATRPTQGDLQTRIADAAKAVTDAQNELAYAKRIAEDDTPWVAVSFHTPLFGPARTVLELLAASVDIDLEQLGYRATVTVEKIKEPVPE